MGTITRLNGSNLYWLGRYTERVFTTLNNFFQYFDRMIDQDTFSYQKFLDCLGVPDNYTDDRDFIEHFLFDKEDPYSIRSSFERALGNGIVLREAIRTPSLSYLQLALDRFKSARGTEKVRYDLLPVRDSIYAFWGSIENNMTDLEGRELIYIGKAVERLDLYIRLSYPREDIQRALDYLTERLYPGQRPFGYIFNEAIYRELACVLESILFSGNRDRDSRDRALGCIENLIEVNPSEESAV